MADLLLTPGKPFWRPLTPHLDQISPRLCPQSWGGSVGSVKPGPEADSGWGAAPLHTYPDLGVLILLPIADPAREALLPCPHQGACPPGTVYSHPSGNSGDGFTGSGLIVLSF